jgi:DNA-binding transcriptional MerR regulator
MGRKAIFDDSVRQRAIVLRERGFTLTDIRDTLRKELGSGPELMWIQRATKCVDVGKVERASAERRARDAVAIAESQAESDGADCDTEMLRTQARELVSLRQELKDNPSAVSQLSRALLATMALIDKRTPPPPPAKEIPPDWDRAAEECRAKMRAELQKLVDKAKNE